MTNFHRHPYLWKIINTIIYGTVVTASTSRVLQATAEQAVHGGHHDRRLYFELFHGLRARGDQSGGKGTTIIFVNDQLARPSGEGNAVTIEAREPSAAGSDGG